MAKSLKAEATCPVCLDFFSKPFSLSCAHTFCCDCIQTWIREREEPILICPMCRRMHERSLLEEWQMIALIFLIKQHGPLLEQRLHLSDRLLRCREDMTLDAATASSLLVLSSDLRSVQCGKICNNPVEDPNRFTYMTCVLGTPCFSTGRHYWEVEVEEGKEWTLGVCKESVDRKVKGSLSTEHGFWIISMKAGAIYSNSFPQIRISASPSLHHVGIFLDIEMEEVKFFDVRNDALIYTHEELSRSEPLRPFFCPEQPGEGDSGAPLRICA
ncbi:ret finger protein-like 4B [Trichechus inunguis]|uniref:LOW QUALITY PROTEIN: ret finger protein-like 4B n=1 Tax=Trichechus manatus latirostris TaxID=127582 RepID=A0A2Y9EDB1_TRIMA|nr:LOW QUALITY PROTEIN: ret finger protein-like 4B [Trichechus manatus latirostris]